MKTAYGYLRASGIGGESTRDSFPRQRETILRYADANDVELIEWFTDDGVPGKTEFHNRPGLSACMAACESGDVKMVIVEISDRLARDTIVNELTIREFQKLQVKVI